ncbi:MAG: GTPase, partial [SAR324 cluster bacterium]|nr:GTPase [SAR324 cluster bacterium]
MSERIRTIIMGAAGRDFHNFNVVFRDNPIYEVVCFTATQIPDIHGRLYPPELAGQYYPNGIPIFDETNLSELINRHHVKEVIFSYSDVSYNYVMRRAALVSSCGASFKILSALETMLKSRIPVVSICAVRTGCGKSQTARKAAKILKQMGKHVVTIRHPMPYGDLLAQKVQRFTTLQDMKEAKCTIEEMEEYEPYIDAGLIIYAGVDYAEILKRAESEAEIILWDGGN